MELTVVFEVLNILLLLFLLSVYLNNYRQIKTSIGLGLIIFSALLLMQNAMAVYFHFAMVDYYSVAVMGHAAILSALQTVALAVLAWVTWKE